MQLPAAVIAGRRDVVHASNAFSTAVYQVLSSKPGNLAFSPLSVAAVMTIAWLGAGGETARQLAVGLHLPGNRSQVEAGFRALLSSLQSTETVTLDIANKMYLQQSFRVKEAFRQSIVDNFRSDAQEVDFANNTEAARITINQWVEEKTHGRIKDLIAKDSLDDKTLAVIVNAIYFKGGWLKPFEEQSTVTEPFHLSVGSSVNVSMMHRTDYFFFTEIPEFNATALKLQYRGESLSMLLLLPDEVDGLGRLEASISTLNLTRVMQEISKTDVIVSLPRFKVEKTLQLKPTLKQLGITNIFNRGANLTGITDEDVYVNKVVQKVFVEVTEKGTEAAAATYFDIVPESLIIPVEFKADHPFLFVVLDDTTGAILFMGRVAQPN